MCNLNNRVLIGCTSLETYGVQELRQYHAKDIISMNMHPRRVAGRATLQARKYDKLSTPGVAKSHTDDDRGHASVTCNSPQDCNK